ncbi:hypothetical protein JOE57_001862 [Microlunatus panaciterrae]|uniref:Trypsin n=1 Tax=Microlunatus panaciterrae TaxID=400768 RepID=A0ABS2RIV9_9ACTN|nr:hypothetical protein [Microlunatus panaciterrae]MBM7798941.1 hypothetical protein [Microlunatus panaciterrae]
MDIPPEVLAAKELFEAPLFEAGLISGCDVGVRDEDAPDPEDLALRVFVPDRDNVPAAVVEATALFPFPVVIIQRVFQITGSLPDIDRERPVLGGVSVAASRFHATGSDFVGTLGSIVRDAADPSVFYGLSNHHVLCHDINRAQGDEIVQPRPSVLGVLPGDRIGTLERWAFPETTATGTVDAAVCRLEVDSVPEIKEIGPVFGTVDVTHAVHVSKRGATTGLTFGWVSGTFLSATADYSDMPAVGASTSRTLTGQLQVHIDFPQTVIFGDSGDSGSVVLAQDDGGFDRVVGLYWASGSASLGDPLEHGVCTPATVVESQLNIRF